MATRKRRPLHKKRQVACENTTSGSESEAKSSTKRTLRPRTPLQQLQCNDMYDADSEPSSSNDTSVKESPPQRHRSTEKLGRFSDAFPFNESENVRPEDRAEHKRERREQGSSNSGRTSGGEHKAVTGVRNFHSSLKKENTTSSPATLRVSFCDESLLERDSPRYASSSDNPKKTAYRPTTYETSTPAVGKRATESTSKVLRVSLSRLSDIASPILLNSSVKRHQPGAENVNQECLSSGYESMLKCDSSMASPSQDIIESKAKRQRVSAPLAANTNSMPYRPPTKPLSRLTSKQRKQMAVERLKEQDDRYLAELEELNDFELCIE